MGGCSRQPPHLDSQGRLSVTYSSILRSDLERKVKVIKRAGIYIRVSSERQAEKVSPQMQEMECRSYCETRGYQVIGVYRDIERYRVGKKLIEPSGTRSD